MRSWEERGRQRRTTAALENILLVPCATSRGAVTFQKEIVYITSLYDDLMSHNVKIFERCQIVKGVPMAQKKVYAIREVLVHKDVKL